jgi:hypothetical protein
MKAFILLLSLIAAILLVKLQTFFHAANVSTPVILGGQQDLMLVKNRIWVLKTDGHIKVCNADGTEVGIKSVRGVRAKLIANNGNDVIAQIGSEIRQWSSADSTWQTINKLPIDAFALLANSQRKIFAITKKGILDISTKETLLPTHGPNHQRSIISTFERPSAYFIDNQDNIWLGFGYGEWGGNVFTYNTQQRKYIDLTFNDFIIELSPIKSFFQLQSSVGSSAGLQHMMNSGSITEFNKFSAKVVYDTNAEGDKLTKAKAIVNWSNMPYIGPATYDQEAHCLYFYSNKGVFKGDYSANLSKLSNWQKLFEPKLHWRYGQRDAVGSQMNVLKMLSLGKNKLVLLTQNDGVGIWDGKTFKLIP